MPKPITKRQKEAIRGYVNKGFSANQIQGKLREQHMGIRRKSLLTQIRKVKGQKPKNETVKYIPKKYAQSRWRARAKAPSRKRLKPLFPDTREKQVAVYGNAQTSAYEPPYSARFEFYGSGRDIRKAVQKAISEGWIPYKKHAFVTVSARAFLNNPEKYGKQGQWTRKPDVRS